MFSDKSCPYCNKNTETKNLDFFYREESYMEVLKYEHQKNNKDISFEEIVKKNLKLVKCGDCKLTFFKHWFDDETSKNIPSHEKPRLSDTFNFACLSLKIFKILILAFSILKIGSAFC